MSSVRLPGVLIASGPWPGEPWAAPFRQNQPERSVTIWPEQPADPSAIEYVLAWKPPSEALKGLPNLRAIFSLGAGVDHIVHVKDLPDVPVVRIVDPDLTMRMTEWVVLQVLLHHRQHLAYARLQSEHRWRELPQAAASAVRIGILGFGELGRASARLLASLGFRVAGWSRTAKPVDGFETFSGADGLTPFLGRTDILVALLPLTADTRGILNRSLFERLARNGPLRGPVLINAGRGGLQVDKDILEALENGLLIGASLDVFDPEPLPPDSPFWDQPNLIVTPHVSATSEAAVLANTIYRSILDFEAGQPLRNVVDPKHRY